MSVIREEDVLKKVLIGLEAFDPGLYSCKKKKAHYSKAGEETGWVEVEGRVIRCINPGCL